LNHDWFACQLQRPEFLQKGSHEGPLFRMFPLSLQSIISNQMRPRRLRGAWLSHLLRHPATRRSGSILSPGPTRGVAILSALPMIISDAVIFAGRHGVLARHLLWRRGTLCGCLCVCIVPKRLSRSSCDRHQVAAQPFYLSRIKYERDILRGSPLYRASNGRGVGESHKIQPIRCWVVCQQ